MQPMQWNMQPILRAPWGTDRPDPSAPASEAVGLPRDSPRYDDRHGGSDVRRGKDKNASVVKRDLCRAAVFPYRPDSGSRTGRSVHFPCTIQHYTSRETAPAVAEARSCLRGFCWVWPRAWPRLRGSSTRCARRRAAPSCRPRRRTTRCGAPSGRCSGSTPPARSARPARNAPSQNRSFGRVAREVEPGIPLRVCAWVGCRPGVCAAGPCCIAPTPPRPRPDHTHTHAGHGVPIAAPGIERAGWEGDVARSWAEATGDGEAGKTRLCTSYRKGHAAQCRRMERAADIPAPVSTPIAAI